MKVKIKLIKELFIFSLKMIMILLVLKGVSGISPFFISIIILFTLAYFVFTFFKKLFVIFSTNIDLRDYNSGHNNFFNTQEFKREKIKRHGVRCFDIDLEEGELILLKDLKDKLNDKDYFIFNNIILPVGNGGSSQIDHLIISKYGIFVLENKDLNGWIFGSLNSSKWIQRFANGFKSSFQNPLRQNYSHIKALQKNIGGMDNKYFNVIAFSENGELKTELPKNVMYYDEVSDYIKSYKKQIISKEKMEQILGKVFMLCQTVDITNEEHIAYLRKKFNKK